MPQRDRQKQKLGRPSQRTRRGAPQKKRKAKMKIKVVLPLAALSYAPPTVAGDKDVYPKERVAEFIVEKLDLTSLPAALRPKKEKGKKTFAEYGFTAQGMDDAGNTIQKAGCAREGAHKLCQPKGGR